MSAFALLHCKPKTIGELRDAYERHLQFRVNRHDFSPRGFGNVKSYLDSFVAFVGPEMSLENQRQYDLTRWLQSNEQWRAKDTRRQAIGAVTGCFHWAEDEGLVAQCVYRTPGCVRSQTTKTRRPATTKEYLAILRRANRFVRWAWWFMWHTGCRPSEMAALEWAHCDLESDCPCARLKKHKTARKGKDRVIAFSPVVAKFMRWLKARNYSRFVFVNTRRRPWKHNSFSQDIRRIARKAGLDFGAEQLVSPYCLRHSFACNLIEKGANLKQAADLLGNSPEMISRIYAASTRQRVEHLNKLANTYK